MTLIFKVDPDIIHVHVHMKFREPRSNGSPLGVMEVLCVGVLKQRNKERNKEIKKKRNSVKIKRPCFALA